MPKKKMIIGVSGAGVLLVGGLIFSIAVGTNASALAAKHGKLVPLNITRAMTLEEGIKTNVQIQEEGSVLLYNKNLGDRNMLPLKASDKVTVLGSYSHNYVQGGTGSAGGKDDAGTVMLDDALYDAGIDYNEEAWDWLTNALGNGDDVHNGTPNASFIAAGDPIASAKGSDFTDYRNMLEFKKETYEQFVTDAVIGSYKDVAIVTFGRSGAEGASPSLDVDGNKDTTTGRVYLELTDNEKDLLRFCKSKFSHTVVLINSAEPMECGFFDNDEFNVDAALWIGHPGEAGIRGVANILAGLVSPSGRTVDTWTFDMSTNPTFYSADDQTYSNIELRSKNKYYQYNEGIYVGYRYYETADAEGVFESDQFKATKFKGNLSQGKYFSELGSGVTYETMKVEGPKATYEGYKEVVQYPFGFGLSYTTFSQEVVSSDVKLEAHGENVIKVKVTNTGNVASKEVVQLYKEAPYNQDNTLGISGVGLEKPKVELVAFGKTQILEPGKSEEVELKFSTDDLTTFDEFGQGSYVLEKGNYIFHVAENAHSWKNDEAYGKDFAKVEKEIASSIIYKEGQAGARVITQNNKTVTEKKAAVNAMNDITAGDGSMLINGGASGTYAYGYLSRKDFNAGMKEIMSYQSDDYQGKYSGNGFVWSADGLGTNPAVTGLGGKRAAANAVKEQIEAKPSELTVDGVNKGKVYNYKSILASGISFGDGKESTTLYGYGNDQAINMEKTRHGVSVDDERYLKSDAGNEIKFNAVYYVALDGDGETVKASDGYTEIFDTEAEASAKGAATKLQAVHLAGVPSDDLDRWDKLANELSFLEADTLFGDNAWHQQNADSVGKVFANSSDGPGEAGNAQKNDNTWWNCACIIAATYNIELAHDEGVAYGHQDILNGTTYAYAPAMNLHRTPFGGRDFEYYSEDGLLSGMIGGSAARGMQDTGIHVFIKHYALNDSDTNRGGVNTWADEMSIRQLYARPYEISTKFFEADGIMGSLNSMGMAWSHSGFYQDMTRDEWGWNGMLITDGDGSGSDQYNNYSFWCFGACGGILGTGLLSSNGTYKEVAQDGSNASNYTKYMLHRIARNALYQYSHNLDILNATTRLEPNNAYPVILISVVDGILAVGVVAFLLYAFIPSKKKAKQQ